MPMPTAEQICVLRRPDEDRGLDPGLGVRHLARPRRWSAPTSSWPWTTRAADQLAGCCVVRRRGSSTGRRSATATASPGGRSSPVTRSCVWHFTSLQSQARGDAGVGRRLTRRDPARRPAHARSFVVAETARRPAVEVASDLPADVSRSSASGLRRSLRSAGSAPPGRRVLAWHDAAMPADPHPSLVDAAPAPYWLDQPRPPAAAPGARRARDGRPLRRRRRLLRALDRDPGQGARPLARRGAARGQPDRLGGIGAQRRVLRRVAHARARERRGALARRDRHARPARPGEPRRDRGHARRATASPATSSGRARSPSPPSRTTSSGCARWPPRHPEARILDRTRCAPR